MSATATPQAPQGKVTRADIEAKFRQLQGDVNTGVESGREIGKVVAVVGVVVAVGLVYLMGRRHGRKKRTIVEIKRV